MRGTCLRLHSGATGLPTGSGTTLPRRALSYMQVWSLVFSPVWMFIGVPVGNGDPPDGSRNQQTCKVLLFVFVSRIDPCWARAVATGLCHCCT